MKTYRSTFEENFKAVPELRANGRGVKMRYVYIGLWYAWNLPAQRVRTVKRRIGAACAFSVLLFFAGGLIDSPLNYDRYVQLLGMLSMAALLFAVIGAVQFCAAKERMNCMDFRDIRTKLLIAPLLHGMLLFCAAVAAAVRMVRGGAAPADMGVVLCYLCSGLLSLAIFFSVRALPYRTEKNADAQIGLDDGDEKNR